jgi:hypothetical protein
VSGEADARARLALFVGPSLMLPSVHSLPMCMCHGVCWIDFVVKLLDALISLILAKLTATYLFLSQSPPTESIRKNKIKRFRTFLLVGLISSS